jgi:hypothetical protein
MSSPGGQASQDGQPDDVWGRETAALIQAAHSCWLVVWAPWRRQFTAFGRFAPVPVVIDEADHDELVNRMRAAELPSPSMAPRRNTRRR